MAHGILLHDVLSQQRLHHDLHIRSRDLEEVIVLIIEDIYH